MTDPEALQTLFCAPSAEAPLGVASLVVPPPDAPVVPPVISSDVPVVPPADIPITYPHVVAPISDSDVTSSTVMEDPVAAHISLTHERDPSFLLWREVHLASESDGAESDSFNLEDFHPNNVFGKLRIQKGVTWANQVNESGWQQASSKRGKQNEKTCYFFAQD